MLPLDFTNTPASPPASRPCSTASWAKFVRPSSSSYFPTSAKPLSNAPLNVLLTEGYIEKVDVDHATACVELREENEKSKIEVS